MPKTIFDFDKNMTYDGGARRPLVWRNAKDPVFAQFGSDALGEESFCRLTEAERAIIQPLNDGEAWCGTHSSGIQIRFYTDSSDLRVRVKLAGPFNMTNMTQIGQCGLDLYVWDDRVVGFALHEVARYDFNATYYEVPLSHFVGAPRKKRLWLMNLPLYMEVKELSIGLDEDATVEPAYFGHDTRIGVYGTSIVHGCAASRPGLSPTNILSRSLDEEVLNFGFSGTAFMEREMGEILGKRKLNLLIVDTEPNAGVDERMEKNTEPFLDAFFAGNPTAPVILVSRMPFALDLYDDYRFRLADYYRGFLKRIAAKYRRRGYKVRFLDGFALFKGNFTEYTTDGIHPNDVGMHLFAEAYEKAVKAIRK